MRCCDYMERRLWVGGWVGWVPWTMAATWLTKVIASASSFLTMTSKWWMSQKPMMAMTLFPGRRGLSIAW